MLMMAFNTFKTVSGGTAVRARISTSAGAHA
jgi:hypothetical protein